jgi:transposase
MMGRVTSARPHLSEFELSIRLKETTGREHRRWLVVWNALVDPRPAREIAIHTGVSVSTVHNVISQYNRFGPKAIEGSEFGKRRRAYLSKDQEADFLKPFLELAPTGEICVARQIRKALEEVLEHEVHHSTVYRMLHRNGWREIVPRPVHPEAKEETQEAFKKNSRNLRPR